MLYLEKLFNNEGLVIKSLYSFTAFKVLYIVKYFNL